MKIINNQDTRLFDELHELVKDSSNIYLSCSQITAYALYEIIDVISKAKSVKVLLNININIDDEFRFIQSASEDILNLKLDRKYRINRITQLFKSKFEVRKGNLANQNILIVENEGVSINFVLTPLNMDCEALGTVPANQPVLINALEDPANQYLNLFTNAWENSKQILNDVLLEHLHKGIQDYDAESIYKYSIREIFQYATVSERADQKLQKVGFKDSAVWNLLYNFQKDAVIGAIEKIETFGGCIIADSVGLGKTFEALAVMKYYQLRNFRILVLAPKKLRENWTVYQLNDKRNILSQDRLNYDVLNHTDLSREKGMSGDINLEMIHWGNYDLVVIDESHNFRNNNPSRTGITRYRRLMNDVIRANIKTKVLMLSATPVNNRMNDLKNQISFITEGNDHAFMEHGIESVTQVMRDAQRRFTNWFRSGNLDDLNMQDLMDSLDGRYFRILDMLTIARSRKHIEKYYDTKEIGKFPNRLVPKTIYPEIDTQNQFKDIGQIYDEISTLTLAAYSPLGYVRSDKQAFYEEKYDMATHTGSVFRQVDREQSLIYLMRVNLLKRLESSIHSFKLTVAKLIDFIDINLQQIEEHKTTSIDFDLNITDIDIDDTEFEDLLVGGRTKVLLQDVDLIRWKQDLKLDKKVLVELMGSIKLITVERDAKLLYLKRLIQDKIDNPINGDNKKLIIFTAFADTASYLYQQLHEDLRIDNKVYSALITGSGTNKTNMPNCRADLSSVLINFSPLSKKRESIFPDEQNQIDVLFCTDCISEGQNLQDCDYVVNYDIHWNPVRIIQRFGRIDRIGSINKNIQLVNFFPSMELDSFIDLVARIQGRMVMLDVSATGEDNLISKNSKEMQDLDYRRRQLKQLQNQVIDLEDVQNNISITDLTFNDFKIDLEQSTDEQIEALNHIPSASFAVVKSNLEEAKEGVIFCLKDDSGENQGKLRNNILHPFFLVYLSLDGETMVKATQNKQALDYFRKLCMGNDAVLPELMEQFNKETKNNKNMDAYLQLLQKALDDVAGVQEEIGLDSLATAGGTTLSSKTVNTKDDLKLVSYLIIK
jgi:SNF2 family DNA or RNA helicase